MAVSNGYAKLSDLLEIKPLEREINMTDYKLKMLVRGMTDGEVDAIVKRCAGIEIPALYASMDERLTFLFGALYPRFKRGTDAEIDGSLLLIEALPKQIVTEVTATIRQLTWPRYLQQNDTDLPSAMAEAEATSVSDAEAEDTA